MSKDRDDGAMPGWSTILAVDPELIRKADALRAARAHDGFDPSEPPLPTPVRFAVEGRSADRLLRESDPFEEATEPPEPAFPDRTDAGVIEPVAMHLEEPALERPRVEHVGATMYDLDATDLRHEFEEPVLENRPVALPIEDPPSPSLAERTQISTAAALGLVLEPPEPEPVRSAVVIADPSFVPRPAPVPAAVTQSRSLEPLPRRSSVSFTPRAVELPMPTSTPSASPLPASSSGRGLDLGDLSPRGADTARARYSVDAQDLTTAGMGLRAASRIIPIALGVLLTLAFLAIFLVGPFSEALRATSKRERKRSVTEAASIGQERSLPRGSLRLRSFPSRAMVEVDGFFIGRTPLLLAPPPADRDYEIRVSVAGKQAAELRVSRDAEGAYRAVQGQTAHAPPARDEQTGHFDLLVELEDPPAVPAPR